MEITVKLKSEFPAFSKGNARKFVAERDDDLSNGVIRYVFDQDLLASNSLYLLIRGENLNGDCDLTLKRTGDTAAPEEEFIPIPGGVNTLSADTVTTADYSISFWNAQRLALTITPDVGLTQGKITKLILIAKDN